MPSISTILTSLLAISASALAYTTPTTFNVTSNPVFTPGSGAIIPVGKPFKITWDPTEQGTVSIILLRGPSTNVIPLYPIVEMIPNSGSYSWTPKADLEADKTHYGIQIIIDSNGQFQYSNQFGISNPGYKPSVTTSSATGYETEPTTTSYATVSLTTKSYITSMVTVTSSKMAPVNSTTTYYTPTYTPPNNNYTATYVPSGTDEPTTAPSSTGVPAPSQTGAAASIKVASGLLLGVAGVAAMLL